MTDDTTDDPSPTTDETPADAAIDDAADGDPPVDAPSAADPPADAPADEAPAGEPDGEAADRTADGGATESSAVREYLLKGALVMLVVLGVVTTLQFYLHTQSAIGRLVASDYRPLFLAAFNLVVLLAVGIGIAQAVRGLG